MPVASRVKLVNGVMIECFKPRFKVLGPALQIFYFSYQIYYTNTVVNVYNLYAGRARAPAKKLWQHVHVSIILINKIMKKSYKYFTNNSAIYMLCFLREFTKKERIKPK